jgi:flagellar biosynthetic protein FliR
MIALNQFLVFVLILTRVAGLFMTAPVFGSRWAPRRVRALASVALALLLTPLHGHVSVEAPGSLVELAVMLGKECILGLSLGLAVLILFSGAQVAGFLIGQMSGMQLAEEIDPSLPTRTSVFGQLLDLTAIAVFVCIGGHRQVMGALLETFEWMPPGQGRFSDNLVSAVGEVTTQSFILGIRAAAPVMAALLIATLIVGLISRTLPQLNTFALGFGLNSVVLLAALAMSLGAAAWVFQDQLLEVMGMIRGALAP